MTFHFFIHWGLGVFNKVLLCIIFYLVNIFFTNVFAAQNERQNKQVSNASIFKNSQITIMEVSSNRQSFDKLIKSARILLENAEIEKALTIIKTIVKQDENNAEAQYLLGITYGFKGQYKLSDEAFHKAELLGYKL